MSGYAQSAPFRSATRSRQKNPGVPSQVTTLEGRPASNSSGHPVETMISIFRSIHACSASLHCTICSLAVRREAFSE